MKKFLILSYNLYWYVVVVSNFLKFLQRTAPFQRLVYYSHFSIKLSTSPPVKTPYPLEHKSYTLFQKIFICDGNIRTLVGPSNLSRLGNKSDQKIDTIIKI